MTVEINTGCSLYTVVFSANGECLLSGGSRVVQVWRVQDGKEMATVQTGGILCLAVSQDGSKIAAGTNVGDVLVWNAVTYEPVFKQEEDGGIHGVDFSPDSTRLVSVSGNKRATIWDIATSRQLLLLQDDYWAVTAAKYSPQGDRIAAAGCDNSEVRVYDSNDGSLLMITEINPFAWYNKGLIWLNDQHLLAVSRHNLIKKFDASTGLIVAEWAVSQVCTDYGAPCISSPSHGKFLAYSTKHTVTFWDALECTQLLPILEHSQDIMSITISPNDRFLAIGERNGKITINNVENINASIHEEGQENQRLCAWGVPGSDLDSASGLLGFIDSTLQSPLCPAFQESDFSVDDSTLNLWKQDQLTHTEAKLTARIAILQKPSHHALTARAIVRARLQEWDMALEDAERSIEVQPSVIGYIAKGIAHVYKGERDRGYRACDIALAHTQSAHTTVLLLMKAIIVFMAGEHLNAISRVDDLIATANSSSICHVVQAYMYLCLGNLQMDCSNYEIAIESLKHARARVRHCKSQLMPIISLLFGWQFDNIDMIIRQRLCDALYEADCVQDAIECFHQMTSQVGELIKLRGEHSEWILHFRQRASVKLEHLGDSARESQQHNEAISHYTSALSLNPPSPQEILIKRAKAFLATCSWQQALEDARWALTLDPLSPWGYEVKHAALHEAGEYGDAIDAFQGMLVAMARSPDPDVRRRGDKYIPPSTTRIEIRKIVQRRIHRLPRVLIHTATGRLYDRAQQASAFESTPVFEELVSSTTTCIDYVRIKREVRQFFRYVMLSHKWEDNEPLFADVMQTAVYDLRTSVTHDKLRMFCKIVRDYEFSWAWSDTCCINKSDHFILQEALVAMFKWYRGSALTIVFLRGVRSTVKLGTLMGSVWNSRAWTLQEYIAAPIVHFYTEDWSLYLDLKIPNHKESPEVISEMEQVTGVSAEQLMSLRPGLSSIREKLRLASTRHTTLVEDAAYSLLGIFSVKGLSAIYGEEDASVGRLLANILTGSGNVAVLAWTGDSGSFNSCLPAHITVFDGPATSHLPSPIVDAEVATIVPSSSVDLRIAFTLYNHLNKLSAPWFAASRMKLPCIAFELPALSAFRTRASRIYRVETSTFGMVKIKTRQDLSKMQPLYLVHPWLDALLGREESNNKVVEGDMLPPSVDEEEEEFVTGEDMDDGPEIPEEEIEDPPVSGYQLLSNPTPVLSARLDRDMEARRLVARLRQPFGGLLLTSTSMGGRAVDYKRVAADALIRVQLRETVSLTEILDNVRTLDVL